MGIIVVYLYQNSCMCILYLMYTAISRKVVGKKNLKVHSTRPKGGLGIHWNFAYWLRGNLQVCIFARGGFVFPLRRPLSVALLLLSHVFE